MDLRTNFELPNNTENVKPMESIKLEQNGCSHYEMAMSFWDPKAEIWNVS